MGFEWKLQDQNDLKIFAKDQWQMIILTSRNSFFLSSGSPVPGDRPAP